jgi:hypothetical protein
MKYFVLVFLLFLFSGNDLFAQSSKAREIVKMALEKHTSGKMLKRYIVKIEYEKPGKTPVDLLQPDPLMIAVDSAMQTLPDSVRKKFELGKIKIEEDAFKMFVDFYVDKKQWREWASEHI